MSKITNQAFVSSEFSTSTQPTQKGNFASNLFSVEYLTDSFKKTRSSSQPNAHPNDIVTFSIELTNISDLDLTDIVILDTLDNNLEFVPQSLTIDSTPYPEANPTQNLTITPLLSPNQTVVVAYRAKISNNPTSDCALSTSRIVFSIDHGPKLSEFSNTTQIPIIYSYSNIEIAKNADLTTAKSGDIITFTNTIITTNIGNTNSAYFVESIPKGTRFVPKTVTINDEIAPTLDPQNGFVINDLKSNTTTIIKYKIEVL